MSVRVRFAPSPTGYLHVGGARTALFNWLFARHFGGVFVLRVEDTDFARERPEYRDEIFRALRWLGLDWDEGPEAGGPYGPYSQRERMETYRAAARDLVRKGRAFPCFCASTDDDEEASKPMCTCETLGEDEVIARTAALGAEPALRFRVDQAQAYLIKDLIRGEVIFPPGQVESFIIIKAGGSPLYNFAAVLDDAAMKITHVIRGEEHLSNTPKQVLLCRALGLEPPQFAHIPIILNTERKKLSKRDGATAVSDFRRLGYLPEALLNFLALVGWSPGEDREIMERPQLIGLFDLERVQKHGAIFDTAKLTWMNGEYIRQAPLDDIVRAATELLSFDAQPDQLRSDARHVRAVCALLHERARTIAEITVAHRYLFTTTAFIEWDEASVQKRAGTLEALDRLRAVRAELADADFEKTSLEARLRSLAERNAAKLGEFVHPVRVAVTGFAVSPGIFEVLDVLGRAVTLARIDAFLASRAQVGVGS